MKRTRTQPTPHAKGGGFTLTEMLVSVAVLSVMIIAFSQILSQVRKVVTHAQLTIRTNTAASAIAEVIRRDFRQVAKSGFLYMRSDGIMATTAGVQHSLRSPTDTTATGSAVHYGLSTEGVLFRQGWLLTGEGTPDPDDDIWDDSEWDDTKGRNIDLADLTAMAADKALIVCDKLADDVVPLVVPPTTLEEVNQMWRVLTPKVSNLKVYWGTVTGTTVTWHDPLIEGNGFWTHENRDDWPDLARIRFQLDAGAFELRALPGGLEPPGVYEVVCRIGH